ncbi:MAG: ribosome silencing factor, partial [Lentisphaeria bacterium]|nr:ribosome silencing factor [Lentisphaeria bacterium]
VTAFTEKTQRKKLTMNETERLNKSREIAEFCIKCAEEKMAENPALLALGSESSIADFFVVIGANNEPQLRALTSFIERQVREVYQLRPLSEENDSTGGWTLLDFGNVIVHVMTAEMREKYDLETLWGEYSKRH